MRKLKTIAHFALESENISSITQDILDSLDGACTDTLIALVEMGPLSDGDLPSKTARDTLIAGGYAIKVIAAREEGMQAATSLGAELYIKLILGIQSTGSLGEAIEQRQKDVAVRPAISEDSDPGDHEFRGDYQSAPIDAATEGFVDWVKDVFTSKISPNDLNKFASHIATITNGYTDLTHPIEIKKGIDPALIFYPIRRDKFVDDLPKEIIRDTDQLDMFHQFLISANQSLGKINLTDSETDISNVLTKYMKDSLIRDFAGSVWLNNFTLAVHKTRVRYDQPIPEHVVFYETDTYGAAIDAIKDEKGNLTISDSIHAALDSIENNRKYEQLLTQLRRTLDFDLDDFKKAGRGLEKKLRVLEGDLQDFLENAQRLAKHQVSSVRDMLRLGYNVSNILIMLVGDMTDFYKHI